MKIGKGHPARVVGKSMAERKRGCPCTVGSYQPAKPTKIGNKTTRCDIVTDCMSFLTTEHATQSFIWSQHLCCFLLDPFPLIFSSPAPEEATQSAMVGLMTAITRVLMACKMSGWLAQLAAVQRHNWERQFPYSSQHGPAHRLGSSMVSSLRTSLHNAFLVLRT
jgi:hypothetical protein